MQLSELRATVSRLLDEDGVRRADSSLNDTLNEGYRVVAMLTQGCERTHSMLYNDTQHFGVLPSDFFMCVSLYHDGTRLYPVRVSDLDMLSVTWVSDSSGTPVYYSTVGGLGARPQLWLHPRPSSVGTVRLTYAAIPGTLSYDSDVPRLPREHHYCVVWWAYMWELLKERGAVFANKAFQVSLRFVEECNALQQYVYRRTPDRDWVSPPLDTEAVTRKLHDFEQALQRPQTTEAQDLAR